MNLRDATTLERQLPLCRTYFAVFLVRQPIETVGQGDSEGGTVQWGAACLADGRFEVLGVWLKHSVEGRVSDIPSSLRLRGVERVHLIMDDDAAAHEVSAAVSEGPSLLPSVTALMRRSAASVGPRTRATLVHTLRHLVEAGCTETADAALSQIAKGSLGARHPTVVLEWGEAMGRLGPLYALPRSLRRLTLLGDSLTQDLRRKLDRSLRRHGAFPSDEAAVEFVRRALARAEPQLREALAAQAALERGRTSSRGQKREAGQVLEHA
jgi:transposase-like protein